MVSEARALFAVHLKEEKFREIAHDFADFGLSLSPVERGQHKAEAGLRAPAGKNQAEGGKQHGRRSKAAGAGEILEPAPFFSRHLGHAPREAGPVHGLRIGGEGQLGTSGKRGDSGHPVGPVRLEARALSGGFLCQHAVAEGQRQGGLLHFRESVPSGDVFQQYAETEGVRDEHVHLDVQAHRFSIKAGGPDGKNGGSVERQDLV